MTEIDFGYNFHPVGQGLFASGFVRHEDSESPFHWVYDCGTSSAQSLLSDTIDNYASRWNTTGRIDLLAISHFDNDHVSGLPVLNPRFSIGTVLLPYVPLWRRLLVAISSGAAFGSVAMNYALDPVKAVSTALQNSFDRIFFVTSKPVPDAPPVDLGDGSVDTDGVRDFDDPFNADLDDDDEFDELRRAGLNIGKDIGFVSNGRPLVCGTHWEFVPYNDASQAGIATPAIIARIRGIVPKIRNGNDDDIKTAVGDLKDIYDAETGAKTATRKKKSELRNIISLFLFAGPLSRAARSLLGSIGYESEFGLPWSSSHYHRVATKLAVLYSGDGFLSDDDKFDALERILTPARIADTGVFQVMHHGALANWHAGVASKIEPAISVFSSDPTRRRPGHPKARVLRDFWPYGAVQVDKHRGLYVSGSTRLV